MQVNFKIGSWLQRFMLLFAAGLILLSCSKKEDGEPYLKVFPSSIVFNEENAAANSIGIESNGSWSVSEIASGLLVDTKQGTNDGAILVKDASVGKSTFVVTMGLLRQTVTVTRMGDNPGPDPNPDPDPDPDPNPDPDPDPDPTPDPGDAVFGKSWAELPADLQKPGDYYYAYHMRPDAGSKRNFTVCYSREMMCPVWVAAPMHSSYKGSAKRTDAYGQDPSLGFTQPGKWDGYTRGHMLGSSDRTISTGTNKQVFYYSNITPQMQSGFNTGGGAWNNLEDFTDGQWCADTLYQVVGSYWANKDKHASGSVIPTHYYKVLLRTKGGNTGKSVANCTADELKCAVFMLEHKSQKGLKPSAAIMMSVSDLEKKTGFDYFPNVPNAPKDTYRPSDWGL